jgi:hypothetical protein
MIERAGKERDFEFEVISQAVTEGAVGFQNLPFGLAA